MRHASRVLRVFLLSAGVSIASTAAFAADLRARPVYKALPPVAPMFSWTGCYLGASGGGLWPTNGSVPIGGDATLVTSQLGNVPLSLNTSGSGYLVGGQIGCNYQTSNWVFGIEADLSYVKAERSAAVTQGPNIVTTSFSEDLRYLGTVRGRLGYAFDTLLFYGTGGLAYGEVRASATIGDAALTSVLSGSQSKTQVGWTAGGGAEWAFTPNWTLRGEYLYYDLGRETLTINAIVGAAETATFNYEAKGHIARAALNYKF